MTVKSCGVGGGIGLTSCGLIRTPGWYFPVEMAAGILTPQIPPRSVALISLHILHWASSRL